MALLSVSSHSAVGSVMLSAGLCLCSWLRLMGPWDTQSARPAAPWCGVQCGAGAGGLLCELEVTVRDRKSDWSSDINVSVRGLCTTPRGFTLRLG